MNKDMGKKTSAKSDKFRHTVPARMQAIRKQQKISQESMAKRLGVSKTYISNIERGITKLPAHILDDYSRELGVPMDLLLADKEDGAEPSVVTDIISAVKTLPREDQEFIYRVAKGLEVTKNSNDS